MEALSTMNAGKHAQPETIPCYEVFELVLETGKEYESPFEEVEVTARFHGPENRTLTVKGFYDGPGANGGSMWRLRAAFDAPGTWRYVVSSNQADSGLAASGAINVTPAASHGFIRLDRDHPYYFVFDDGTRFFPMGDTAYQMCIWPEADQDAYLNRRSAQRFNFIRMLVAPWHRPEHGYSSPSTDILPWSGTHKRPDFSTLNLDLFRKVENAIRRIGDRGMRVELILENAHNESFAKLWENGDRSSHESRYLEYIVRRFSAYRSIFLWTVANEFTAYPDGLEGPQTQSRVQHDTGAFGWAQWVGSRLHEVDPFGHLTTAHPHTFNTVDLGEFFGNSPHIDVICQQYVGRESDAQGIEVPILSQRIYRKPVMSTESGYERQPGIGLPFPSAHALTPDRCRKAAWRVFVAGAGGYANGFECWAYSGPQTFFQGTYVPLVLIDEAHTRTYLYEFVTQKTRYWTMRPSEDALQSRSSPDIHCLADPGSEYVVLFPQRGDVALDLRDYPVEFDAEWLDPKTGTYLPHPRVIGGAAVRLASPLPEDCVLHLVKTS